MAHAENLINTSSMYEHHHGSILDMVSTGKVCGKVLNQGTRIIIYIYLIDETVQ